MGIRKIGQTDKPDRSGRELSSRDLELARRCVECAKDSYEPAGTGAGMGFDFPSAPRQVAAEVNFALVGTVTLDVGESFVAIAFRGTHVTENWIQDVDVELVSMEY